ncbi:MAG TPA: hypothetical protein PKN48_12585 [Bacteroidales bacterium]|nr:hypothetical protein [Bacteroidales bacterium]
MKEYLIVFTFPHFAYSPTTLNLFNELKKHYAVELVTPRPVKAYSLHEIDDPCVKYFDEIGQLTIFERMTETLKKIKDKFNKPSARRLFEREIISYIKKKKNKEIIAVDYMALWCAQMAGRKAHLVSLEIFENQNYKNLNNILSVIIQSEERMNYLFPDNKPPYFLVQNAPKYIDFAPSYESREKTDLIYCGSAVPGFGLISCLDFIKDHKEYTLTTVGAMPDETKLVIDKFYSDLLVEKRLIINKDYFSATELTHYVSKFRIGFAFYDFYRYAHLRTFNYFSVPSGKVFQYLNSGLPVIANNMSGLKFIEDTQCGKLIDYISSIQIKAAIDAIERDYEHFAKNAKSFSKENDFETQINPFIKYLEGLD